jgi:hypothetical protein
LRALNRSANYQADAFFVGLFLPQRFSTAAFAGNAGMQFGLLGDMSQVSRPIVEKVHLRQYLPSLGRQYLCDRRDRAGVW